MGCHDCCSSCSGCARELSLTNNELDVLRLLGQIPFLPIARRPDSMTPSCLECDGIVLEHLERKGLVSLDYDAPLGGFDYSAFPGLKVHGSMALTSRGQTVVELLELQGIQE